MIEMYNIYRCCSVKAIFQDVKRIVVMDKENGEAAHFSARNSIYFYCWHVVFVYPALIRGSVHGLWKKFRPLFIGCILGIKINIEIYFTPEICF